MEQIPSGSYFKYFFGTSNPAFFKAWAYSGLLRRYSDSPYSFLSSSINFWRLIKERSSIIKMQLQIPYERVKIKESSEREKRNGKVQQRI
jgi:hypothetical protein